MNIEFTLAIPNPGESVYAYLYDGGCYGYDTPGNVRRHDQYPGKRLTHRHI